MNKIITPGMKTSEFFLTIIVLLASLAAIGTGHGDYVSTYWQPIVALVAAYGGARGLSKITTPTTVQEAEKDIVDVVQEAQAPVPPVVPPTPPAA